MTRMQEMMAEQDYLLTVYLADELRSQNLSAHRIHNQLYLHFGEFIEVVEFAITETEQGWQGWAYHQSRLFHMPHDDDQVFSNQLTFLTSASSTITIDGELFVSVDDLAQWFDLTVLQKLPEQEILITSLHSFPFESRSTRQARVQYLNSVEKAEPVAIPDQYHLWTSPRTFWQAQHQWSHQQDSSSYNTSVAATSSFDLLHHQTFFSGNLSKSEYASIEGNARLTFSRRANENGGELFLGATNYQFGDIYLNESGLLGVNGSGVGFDIQRNYQTNLSRSEGALITGNAPPNWDAELYNNGQLLGLVKVDAQGRYVFSDQPTAFGLNKFEVRIYGPQGQTETQIHKVWGGGQRLKKGEYGYRVAHVNYLDDFLNGEKDNAYNLVAHKADVAQLEFGLTDHIMLGVGAYTVDGHWSANQLLSIDEPFDSQEQYFGVELQADLFNGTGYAEWLRQENAASSVMFGYRGNLDEHQVNYQFQHFDESFYSPFTERVGHLNVRQRLLFNGPVEHWFNSYQLTVNHDRLHVGNNKLSAKLRVSKQWQRMFFHHTFEYEGMSSLDNRYRGKLEATARFDDIALSGGLSYHVEQGMNIDQLQLTARWRPHREVFATSRLTHTMNQSNVTILQQQFSLQKDWANINMHFSFGSDDYFAFGIGISSYFGDGRSSRRNLIHHARVELTPFLDENGNNEFDMGEPPIEGAFLHRKSSDDPSLTIEDMPGYYEAELSLQELSLPDPYMSATQKTLAFYTHPGAKLTVPVPVRYTGDIEGQVWLDAKQQNKIMGLALTLVDENDNVVAQTHSEFDGYFSFTAIPTGRYALQYQGEQGEVVKQWVTLDAEESYLNVPVIINK